MTSYAPFKYYFLKSMTPISDLSAKSINYLSLATESSYNSTFADSRKVGSCLVYKKNCFQRL